MKGGLAANTTKTSEPKGSLQSTCTRPVNIPKRLVPQRRKSQYEAGVCDRTSTRFPNSNTGRLSLATIYRVFLQIRGIDTKLRLRKQDYSDEGFACCKNNGNKLLSLFAFHLTLGIQYNMWQDPDEVGSQKQRIRPQINRSDHDTKLTSSPHFHKVHYTMNQVACCHLQPIYKR